MLKEVCMNMINEERGDVTGFKLVTPRYRKQYTGHKIVPKYLETIPTVTRPND